MFKKSLILFTLLTLIFSLSLTVAYASKIVASGECGENATWTLDSDGLLTISGMGEMKNYSTTDESPWRGDKPVKVIVKNGITRVGDYAFSGCVNVEEISIADTVKEIGHHGFYYCEKVENIQLPETLEFLGYYAFHDTKWYNNQPEGIVYLDSFLYYYKWFGNPHEPQKIIVPEGIKGIVNGAFNEYKGEFEIVFPSTLERIGVNAFLECENISSVIFSEGLKEIGRNAFFGCSNMKVNGFPHSLTYIGQQAFFKCSSIDKVELGDNLETIGKEAFKFCDAVTDVVFRAR